MTRAVAIAFWTVAFIVSDVFLSLVLGGVVAAILALDVDSPNGPLT